MVIAAYLVGVAIGLVAGSSIIVEMAKENAKNRTRDAIAYLIKRGVISFDQEAFDRVKKEVGL